MGVSDEDKKQADRAQAASLMMPWPMAAQVCAEKLGVDYEAVSDLADEDVVGVLAELGFTREAWAAELPYTEFLSPQQLESILEGLDLEPWFAENIRRAVREEDPLPFGLGVGGSFIDVSLGADSPMVWAVATSMSDPEAVSKAFLRNCRRVLGKQAFRDVSQHTPRTKAHRLSPEQMVAMHARKISYKEIAIQSLRDEYPGITADPDGFKAVLKTERSRIIKVVRAAQALWKKRAPDTSIG